MLRRLGLGVLFAALTVGMTFRNPSRMSSHFPGNLGDNVLIEWIMQWNVHALINDPWNVFDPNIYWPTQNVLVYSDTLLAAAPVNFVLNGLFGWPLGFNLHYLINGVMSLVAAYLLARWFTRDTRASVLAAIVFSFAAVRLAHYGHFQLTYAWLVPMVLWLLLRFLTERESNPRAWWWQAGGVGVAWSATFLNAGYLALALLPAMAIVAGGWLIAERGRPGRRFWAGVAVCGVVVAAICLPVVYKFTLEGDRLKRGFDPSAAAHPGDFLAPAMGSYLYGPLEDWADRSHENRLFPGLLAAGLGAVGAVVAARRHRRGGSTPLAGPGAGEAMRRRAIFLLSGGGLAAVVMALGEWQTVGGQRIFLPYAVISRLGPGFDSVRAFGRFTVVALAVLAVLVAVGFTHLVAGRGRIVGAAAATAVGALMLVEYAIPIEMVRRFDEPRHTAVNHALAALPPGPVVELPVGDAHQFIWGFTEPPRMLLSTIDWRPRVNGYTGYFPPGYLTTVDLLNSLADPGPATPAALARLDDLGVRYIVIRTAAFAAHLAIPGVTYYTPEQAAEVVSSIPGERISAVDREGDALLLRLRPPA